MTPLLVSVEKDSFSIFATGEKNRLSRLEHSDEAFSMSGRIL